MKLNIAMTGIDKDNFEALTNNLKTAIAEALGVVKDKIELSQAHETGNETMDTPKESLIVAIIQATDQTDMENLLMTANDSTYFTEELAQLMKKRNIPDVVEITKVWKSLFNQRKDLNFYHYIHGHILKICNRRSYNPPFPFGS